MPLAVSAQRITRNTPSSVCSVGYGATRIRYTATLFLIMTLYLMMSCCCMCVLLSAAVFTVGVCCCCYLLPWSLLVNPPLCSFKHRVARTIPRNHSSSQLVVPNSAAVIRAVTTAPSVGIRLMLENTTAYPRSLATLEASR